MYVCTYCIVTHPHVLQYQNGKLLQQEHTCAYTYTHVYLCLVCCVSDNVAVQILANFEQSCSYEQLLCRMFDQKVYTSTVNIYLHTYVQL